ncbi:MAG TPA: hypothetical protein VLT90_15290 [Terriglobales bacterium]|nr:hypothetical protein [Terriglobales bacterium]
MARLLSILLLSALATAQVGSEPPARNPATVPSASAPENESSRKARALISQAVQVLGGQAYLTADTRAEQGRWYSLYHGQSRGEGVQYRQFARYPDQDRLELLGRGTVFVPIPLFGSVDVITVGRQKKSADFVVIHNGDKGYEISNKGTAAQDKDDLKTYLRRRQHSLQLVLRTWIHDPTLQFFYDGVTVVDGKPTDQVTLLNSKNDAVTVYLDQDSHLPVKNSYTWRDPQDKQKNTEEEIYDNYKLVQGIMTPHSISRTFNGEPSHQRFISTVRYNLPLPDGTFDANVTYDPLAPPKKK